MMLLPMANIVIYDSTVSHASLWQPITAHVGLQEGAEAETTKIRN